MGKRRGGGGGGGGRGRGRGGGGGGGEDGDFDGGGGYQDQYGGFGSQDRDDKPQFSGKSNTAGGSAGGSSKPGSNLTFQRHVPKFLQRYQHMLGGRGGQPSEDEPTVDDGGLSASQLARKGPGNDDDSDDDARKGHGGEDVELEALKRAMAENPALAKEFEGALSKRLSQAEALEEKERGNRLFSDKKYKEAIQSFTKCIELDPSNEVFYSNRSACHASLEQWQAALDDGRHAARLKPNWAKAHQRVGAAYLALELYSEAKEAYEKAAKLEPDNQAIHTALQKAEMGELQQAAEKKHVFKKHRISEPPAAAAPAAGSSRLAMGSAGAGSRGREEGGKKKALLSFDDGEEE